MVRKQDYTKYPNLPNGILFHFIFFLSMAMGNAVFSHIWNSNYDKRCNKNNNADARQ